MSHHVSNDSWAQVTFLIIINVETCFAALYFCAHFSGFCNY